MLAKTVTRSLLCLTAVASALPHNPKTRRASSASDSAVSENNQPEWYHRNLKTIQTIYDYTVYPANTAIIAQGRKAVPPGLFAPDATGRVSPVGNFTGFEDSIEYFFALAPTPQGNPESTAFYKAEVVDFVSGCPNVASSLVYFRTGKLDEAGQLQEDGPKTTLSQVNDPHRTLRRREHHSDDETVLSQVAFFHFNDAGEVDKYQAWIPNLQKWVKISSGIDYTNMQVQQAATQQLCPQIQKQCTGANQQFSSVNDCAAQLGAKPFGDFDEAWGDNIACRTIHTLLTIVRPDIHCPHVGPTGGGKCVDIDYSDDYFDDAELFGEALGSTFTCSGPIPPSDNAPAKMAQQALLAMGGNPSSIADAMAALPASSGSDQYNTINKRDTPPPTMKTYDDKPAENKTSPPTPPTKPSTDQAKKPDTPKMPDSKSYGAPPAKNETSPPTPPTKPPTDQLKKPVMPPTMPPAKNDTDCETPPAPATYGKQPSAPPTNSTPPATPPKSPVTPPTPPSAGGYSSGAMPAPVPGSGMPPSGPPSGMTPPTTQSGTGLAPGGPVPAPPASQGYGTQAMPPPGQAAGLPAAPPASQGYGTQAMPPPVHAPVAPQGQGYGNSLPSPPPSYAPQAGGYGQSPSYPAPMYNQMLSSVPGIGSPLNGPGQQVNSAPGAPMNSPLNSLSSAGGGASGLTSLLPVKRGENLADGNMPTAPAVGASQVQASGPPMAPPKVGTDANPAAVASSNAINGLPPQTVPGQASAAGMPAAAPVGYAPQGYGSSALPAAKPAMHPTEPQKSPVSPPAKNETAPLSPPPSKPQGYGTSNMPPAEPLKSPVSPPTPQGYGSSAMPPPITPKDPVSSPPVKPQGYGSGNLPTPQGNGMSGTPANPACQSCADAMKNSTSGMPPSPPPKSGTPSNPAAQSAADAMKTVPQDAPQGSPQSGTPSNPAAQSAAGAMKTPLTGGTGQQIPPSSGVGGGLTAAPGGSNPAAVASQNAINGLPPQTVPGQGPGMPPSSGGYQGSALPAGGPNAPPSLPPTTGGGYGNGLPTPPPPSYPAAPGYPPSSGFPGYPPAPGYVPSSGFPGHPPLPPPGGLPSPFGFPGGLPSSPFPALPGTGGGALPFNPLVPGSSPFGNPLPAAGSLPFAGAAGGLGGFGGLGGGVLPFKRDVASSA